MVIRVRRRCLLLLRLRLLLAVHLLLHLLHVLLLLHLLLLLLLLWVSHVRLGVLPLDRRVDVR